MSIVGMFLLNTFGPMLLEAVARVKAHMMLPSAKLLLHFIVECFLL